METYLFFAHRGHSEVPEIVAAAPDREGYATEVWRPSLASLRPRGLPVYPFAVWWLFHFLRVFANRDYAVVCVRCRGVLVHRSCVFPRYFRFPFMAAGDLQVGDTWTDERHRGRGLATHALRSIVHAMRRPGRCFWYLVEETNAASVRAVEKAGFVRSGHGRRTAPLGVGLLGAFRKDDRQA